KRSDGTSRVQVSPELVRVASASTTWQEPFDAPLTDVFQVQADVAGRVAQALGVALGTGERERLGEQPTENLAAYDAFLRGEDASDRMGTGSLARLRRAVALYEQAVALDSAFVLAWVQLSRARTAVYANSTPSPATASAAYAAAERALRLAPDRADVHLALGDYYQGVLKDDARAFAEYAPGLRREPRHAELVAASAAAEIGLGRWDDALRHLREAVALDPRGPNPARRLARTLLWLRRYPEALDAARRSTALAPADPLRYQTEAMIHLAQGDLAGAQAVLRSVPKDVEPTDLVASVANYWDLYWVLDEAQQQLLLRLTPTAFDDDRGAWGLSLAGTYALRGDSARMRAFADSARLALEEQLRDNPRDVQVRMLHGVALAYLGRKAAAVQEGERALALHSQVLEAYPYTRHQLARIYLLVGETDKAIDGLEWLLRVPYFLSPAWLKIDPTLAPLRGNPRFERLVNGS
ncbi:MAG TPA: tetratricopeptide repeat protein, partial [Gemmatimonadales bacterium]|nr:tetratricopeptide repeat protein [Gemmatimonadales bacterium]